MSNIMLKELKLSASPLAFIFIAFGLMFLLPGYPILCSAFFVTLGLFQSFQTAREANDIVFSALLPIAKKDVVKGKFIFVCFIEACAFVLMVICAIVRMTALRESPVYLQNALMNANLFALGAALVIYGLFNVIFLGGFFKTAYKLGKPFVTYIIVGFIMIGVFEALHHIPGLGQLNAFGSDSLGLQVVTLIAGALIFAVMTLISYKASCSNFEKIDL
ncbi:MAG: ABC-2 transporter permease [Firmicutes bacterium]|nr:ABC-2 transporter permease [Bacillota bacterium]